MDSALVKTTRIWECRPHFGKSLGVGFAREGQFGIEVLILMEEMGYNNVRRRIFLEWILTLLFR
jgi:hypothetical protein